MRALVAFLLGYYLGTREGRERISQLVQTARDIASSPEFQAVRSSFETLAKQILHELQKDFAPGRGPDVSHIGDAWKAISESPEFRELLATAAAVLQGLLSSFAPQDRDERPESH